MNLYKKVKENSILALKIGIITVVILGLGTGINYVLAAWGPPTLPAPQGQIDPPINTGLLGQSKQGGLGVAQGTGIFTGFSVFNGRTGIGTTNPTAKLHVRRNANDLPTLPIMRIETGQTGITGRVLTAMDEEGNVSWEVGGGGGGGSGGAGLTSYTTHCSWLVAGIAGQGINQNNYPDPSNLGITQFWRNSCQNPDGSGSFQPPACHADSVDMGVTCYPMGVSLDTSINEGSQSNHWNYMARHATVGTCERTCAWPNPNN